MGLFARATESLGRVFQPLVVFGQVPLVFYVTHLYLYGILGPGGRSSMSDTSFAEMARLGERLERTSKRLELAALLADFQ